MLRKLLLLLLSVGAARAQTLRSLYIDFGVNDVTNGNSTPSPDANGNYWNNVLNQTTAADTFRLVDKTNAATGLKLKVGANFLTNGILTGGLLAPSAALLGSEYAVATATQDYFFVQGTGSTSTGVLRLSGCDPTKRYVFHVFGSRAATTELRTSQYKFTGSTVSTITQTTTGTGVGANGYAGNNNTIAKSDTIAADASGTILLELSKVAGSYAYLNLMKVDIVPGKVAAVPLSYVFQNPGFELGNLTYWSTVSKGSSPAASAAAAITHTGSYAARLAGSSLSLEQRIGYQSGGSYKLSGYFYQAAEALQGSQAAHLELSFYNSAMGLLGKTRSDSVGAGMASGSWVRKEAIGTVPAGTTYIKGAVVWNNAAGAVGSVYFDDLQLDTYYPINELKIVYFGSSVPYGQGATNLYGYTSRYAKVLAQRNASGQGAAWVTSNISVPGNSTVEVLGRWNSDLLPQGGRYVVYALALGNEGIHEYGQPRFDQFKTNMLQLIRQARDQGLVPVVTNNYTRNDYTPTDYAFIKQMNLLLHSWAVPTVNLLGAVDDGTGHWAYGFWDDVLHPNDLGHAELGHALVPSLFDALRAGKPLPHRTATSYVKITKTAGQADGIRFVPETLVHPFTQVISFRTTGTGRLLELQDSTSKGSLSIGTNGQLTYTSAKTGTLTSARRVNDNKWHKATLTHYFARGETVFYLDSTNVGSLAEQLRTRQLTVGGPGAPQGTQYRNWLFYRSGMNTDEVNAMVADSLLKSSLELYAPLDGRRLTTSDSLANLAQSTNQLVRVSAAALGTRTPYSSLQFTCYPNPTADTVTFGPTPAPDGSLLTIHDLEGRVVLNGPIRHNSFSVEALPRGIYSLAIRYGDETLHCRLVRE
ncbi:GDSL-type esterase/lipase family protein [Hymenobacter sp. BRD67]|uniref:GDSL-type esterase/lipase family protein n=1 Tax=Hymenobacter sp. BRD67 TaxID=2675877 RepID=UPI0015635E1D|nr:GDSL-type esterase/lipase family protein [Hymenobacter sp. BRD67]QKG51440.1 T9SS type A sorting domain-containing protein [Hymenobacter sp. BRD67]